jgi:AAA domain
MITRKKANESGPPRVLIYGTEGVGKTWLSQRARRPLTIDMEDGLGQLEADVIDRPENWEQLMATLGWIVDHAGSDWAYDTLVIDTIDAVEHKIIHPYVAKRAGKSSINEILFADGYRTAATMMTSLVRRLDDVRAAGMGVLMLAHATASKVRTPDGEHRAYAPRMHDLASNVVCEWMDAVLFATSVDVASEKKNVRYVKSVTDSEGRPETILRCIGTADCIAKNRYGMPASIPMDHSVVAQYVPLFTGE